MELTGLRWPERRPPLEFQAGDTNYEYEFRVPRACQRNYRRYRLKFSGRDAPGDRLCVSEIKFFGSFRQHLDLIWNGPSTGGTWDAASRNWLHNGIATNWIPGARAVINASDLSVNGTQVVCGMKFADVDNPTVCGGTFEFIPSATIDVGSATNVTIASDLSGAFTGEDAVSGCVLGERTSMTNLPRLSAAKPQEGESVIWWRNRNLEDVTRVVSGNIYFDAYKGQKSAQPLVWSEDRTTATCWLYYQHGSGESGLSWVAVKLELKQVGTDIAARLIKGGYVWLQPDEYGDDGSKIDFDELAAFRIQNIKDDANDGKVGLKDILLESSCTPCVSIVNGLDGGISRCQDKLPRDANKQGVWTTVAEGVRLSEFQPGDADVYYNNSDVERGYPCYEIRTEDALSIQYHRMNQGGDALLGVKVEFRENEGCIQARHVYSKYQRGDHAYPGGCDFDAEGIVNSQFEVAFRTFSLSARTVNLSGDVDLKGELFLYRTDVRFTGSSVGLPVSATVDGLLAFAPASGTQAIGVSAGSHILPAATFAGQTSIAFAEGGSLAIGEVDLDAATSIGLPAGLGQTAFRIGESAVLSKAELKKFTIADSTRRAVQDANGYIRDAERGGLILLFR